MPTCLCGQTFTKTTNRRWCSRDCPAFKKKRAASTKNWYLRNKAKPYDPNGVCHCGAEFLRRFGGKEQKYCSSKCRSKFTARYWRRKNSERGHEIVRKSRFKRHGLSFEHYIEMLTAQGGICAICAGTDPGATHGRKRRYFSVDHCHATRRIRGLLCTKCNTGIGMFRDNPDWLKRAAEYLIQHLG